MLIDMRAGGVLVIAAVATLLRLAGAKMTRSRQTSSILNDHHRYAVNVAEY